MHHTITILCENALMGKEEEEEEKRSKKTNAIGLLALNTVCLKWPQTNRNPH